MLHAFIAGAPALWSLSFAGNPVAEMLPLDGLLLTGWPALVSLAGFPTLRHVSIGGHRLQALPPDLRAFPLLHIHAANGTLPRCPVGSRAD